MTSIINTDNRRVRDAALVTRPTGESRLCIATWAAPTYGWSRVDGNGHGWQVVKAQANGTYTYNDDMAGGFRDSREEIVALAAKNGYEMI